MLAKPQGEDAALAVLQTSRNEEIELEEKEVKTFMDLKANAPDLDMARATQERLLSAEKADRDEVNKLERELARVDGAIETQSEGAVEEKLAEVTDQLEKAGRILAAWCELREGFRYFGTDRMVTAGILEQRIPEGALVLRARWQATMDEERAF